MLGGGEKRRQQADGLEDLQRVRLDRRRARLAVRPPVALDQPRLHVVAGELGSGEQSGGAGADDHDVVHGGPDSIGSRVIMRASRRRRMP